MMIVTVRTNAIQPLAYFLNPFIVHLQACGLRFIVRSSCDSSFNMGRTSTKSVARVYTDVNARLGPSWHEYGLLRA
jgi:hypothetical protein